MTTFRKNFASFVQQVLFVVKDNVEFLCKAEVGSFGTSKKCHRIIECNKSSDDWT